MGKLLILKGLPGSGKTTRAKELLHKDPTFKRVNMDSLRAMLDNSDYSRVDNAMVAKMRNMAIEECLRKGYNVVSDDTNLSASSEKDLRRLALKYNADVGCQFFDVPVKECIERDSKRESTAQVGEKVIRGMYNRYLANRKNFKVENPLEIEDFQEDKVEWIDGLPLAIICDIDGTLAINASGRSPYDWHRCGEDTLCKPVADLLARYQAKHCLDLDSAYTILMSGRDEVCRQETETWLTLNEVSFDMLLMRPESNVEKDSVIKRRLFDQNIREKYNVLCVIDDRKQVKEMWVNLGLFVFDVNQKDLIF